MFVILQVKVLTFSKLGVKLKAPQKLPVSANLANAISMKNMTK